MGLAEQVNWSDETRRMEDVSHVNHIARAIEPFLAGTGSPQPPPPILNSQHSGTGTSYNTRSYIDGEETERELRRQGVDGQSRRRNESKPKWRS